MERESGNFMSTTNLSGLFNKLTIMSKNPTIETDLVQVLDEFLEKLNECDSYLENGIFNINFAEAALLLQCSADIYCKKVDILWDSVFDYQKRILLADEQNSNKDQEIVKLEERKRKYKRKRKTKELEHQTTKLIDSFSFGKCSDFDYLKADYEPDDVLDEWEKINVQMEPKEKRENFNLNRASICVPATAIYNEDNEYVGRYDQFHSMSLVEDIIHLENQKILEDEQNFITDVRIDTYVINDFLLENRIPATVSVEEYSVDLTKYVNQFIESRRRNAQDNLPCYDFSSGSFRQSFVDVENLPLAVLKGKRLSTADSMFDDDHFSSVSENCQSPINECADVDKSPARDNCDEEISQISAEAAGDTSTATTEKRNKSCSQDSAFYELEDVEELPNGDDLNTALPEVTPAKEQTIVTVDKPCFGGSVVIPTTRAIKRRPVLDALLKLEKDEEVAKRRKVTRKPRRVSEKVLRRLATGITADHRDFEKFFRHQYQPSENEGAVPPESDSSEEEDVSDSSDDEDIYVYHPTVTPNPTEEEAEAPELTEVHEPTEIPEPTETPHQPPPSYTLTELEESQRNVSQWRSFILPKLKQLENRSDFDIHEYGSKIIETHQVGEEMSFGSVVEGKGKAEAVRYFMATLHLATTNNVEIVGVVSGEVANESMRVKIVDKQRHHELLEEYQAPSEETFRERLERAQAKNPNMRLHSTPAGVSPKKKLKMGGVSRKKLFWE